MLRQLAHQPSTISPQFDPPQNILWAIYYLSSILPPQNILHAWIRTTKKVPWCWPKQDNHWTQDIISHPCNGISGTSLLNSAPLGLPLNFFANRSTKQLFTIATVTSDGQVFLKRDPNLLARANPICYECFQSPPKCARYHSSLFQKSTLHSPMPLVHLSPLPFQLPAFG